MLALLAVQASGCSPEPENTPSAEPAPAAGAERTAIARAGGPNVLVISIDTLRRDHVSAYGYERETTPNIDALASEGALFRHAVSSSNWTLPAHMSLMTGLPPSLHCVEDDRQPLPDHIATLAETLGGAGYSTAGVTSHIYLGPKYGFGRGFERYINTPDQRAEEVTDQAIEWLEAGDERPFFLFLHYFDPHWGYDPPEPFLSRFGESDRRYGGSGYLLEHLNPELPLPAEALPHVLRLYDGEIAYTDHHIGRLADWLRERGVLDNTIVVVTADHGEEFGDHGSYGHGTHMHGEVTDVPLVMRHPASIEPGEQEGIATLTDLPRTLLRLSGVPVPPQFRARAADLFDTSVGERLVVIESTRWGPKRFAVQDTRFKLTTQASYSPIMFTREDERSVATRMPTQVLAPGLFDLNADASESVNRMAEAAQLRGAELVNGLETYLEICVPALELRCLRQSPGEPFAFELICDGPLLDDPFVPLSRIDLEVLATSPAHLRVSPPADVMEAKVFLSLANVSSIQVALKRDGLPDEGETVLLSELGEVRRLVGSGPDKPTLELRATSPGLGPARRSLDLSAEELGVLRSLGYVR